MEFWAAGVQASSINGAGFQALGPLGGSLAVVGSMQNLKRLDVFDSTMATNFTFKAKKLRQLLRGLEYRADAEATWAVHRGEETGPTYYAPAIKVRPLRGATRDSNGWIKYKYPRKLQDVDFYAPREKKESQSRYTLHRKEKRKAIEDLISGKKRKLDATCRGKEIWSNTIQEPTPPLSQRVRRASPPPKPYALDRISRYMQISGGFHSIRSPSSSPEPPASVRPRKFPSSTPKPKESQVKSFASQPEVSQNPFEEFHFSQYLGEDPPSTTTDDEEVLPASLFKTPASAKAITGTELPPSSAGTFVNPYEVYTISSDSEDIPSPTSASTATTDNSGLMTPSSTLLTHPLQLRRFINPSDIYGTDSDSKDGTPSTFTSSYRAFGSQPKPNLSAFRSSSQLGTPSRGTFGTPAPSGVTGAIGQFPPYGYSTDAFDFFDVNAPAPYSQFMQPASTAAGFGQPAQTTTYNAGKHTYNHQISTSAGLTQTTTLLSTQNETPRKLVDPFDVYYISSDSVPELALNPTIAAQEIPTTAPHIPITSLLN